MVNVKRQSFFLALFITAFFAALVFVQQRARGAELSGDVGSSHSVVASLGLDARAAALGWSVTGVEMGVGGMEYNPASLARLDGRSFYLGHLSWVLDAHLSQAMLALPFRDQGVVGLSLLHFDQGTVDEVLEDGTFTGERLGARDFQAAAALARPLGRYVDLGVKLTVFHKTLGRERAGGAMASLGVITPEIEGFRFGAAILDAGPELRFREQKDPSPTRTRLGLSHGFEIAELFRIQNSLDYMVPRDNFASFGFGTEWDYRDILILRAGYRRTLEEDDTPDGDRFHYGCGLRVGNYRFDYAFSPKENFEAVHHMVVTFEFRGEKEDAAERARERALGRQVFARAAAYDSLLAVHEAAADSLPAEEPQAPALPQVTILRGITFDPGSKALDERSAGVLDEIFARLVNTPGIEGIEIQGHTDSSGDAATNQGLSLERAKVVRDYLVVLGYPERRIGVMGFGPERPLASNDTPEGRAANRRIEIHVIRRADLE